MPQQLSKEFLFQVDNTYSKVSHYDELVESLEQFSLLISHSDIEISQHIERYIQYLKREAVTLTFGGHFSAGKSTLINSLLGMQLLSVNDLPETGVICFLKKGDENTAAIKSQLNFRAIPCTPEAIEKEISLITEIGEYQFHSEKEGLYITLKDIPIASNVFLIDSPGINDSGIGDDNEIEKSAKRAADIADTLFWIVSSEHIFADVEAKFLMRHIAEHGPDSVVFVLNLFLREDNQFEWEKKKEKFIPALYNRLNAFSRSANLSETWLPQIIVVSGRAMWRTEKNFGWNEIINEIAARSNINFLQIQKVRVFYISQQLKKIIDFLKRKISVEESKLNNLRIDWVKFNKDKNNLTSNLNREIESFLKILDYKFAQSGMEIIERIKKDPLKRDDSYSNDLSNSLSQILNAELTSLFERIDVIANSYNFNFYSWNDLFNSIFNMLTPGRLSILVPDTDLKFSTVAKGAGLGAAAGTVVPIVGTFFGAIVGGGTALIKSAMDAGKEDITILENSINSSLQQVRMNLENAKDQIISSVCLKLSYKIAIESYDETNFQRLDWECKKLSSIVAAVV